MDFVGIVMFAVLVALCVFFIVCGIQFGRGKWLGLVIKQKPVRKKSALPLGRAFRMSCSPQLSHLFCRL